MAKYSDIKGFTVQTLSSDTVASQFVGGTWSSGGALNTARSGLTSNAVGTQTAGMASGGSVSPRQQNEQYNGSSWTEVGDLTSGHSFAGAFGTSTASILAGGEISTVLDTVEVWDGSSWTETTEINTARSSMGSYGSSYTAGAVVGGYSTTNTSLNENWNGSAWTELADLGTARHSLVGSGTGAASALAAGGGTSALTEEFTAPSDFNQIQEGQLFFNSTTNAFKETVQDVPTTAWASGANYPAPVYLISHFGTNTAALLAGGSINNPGGGPSQNAYTYDGASWSEIAELNSAHTEHGGFGRVTTGAVVGASLNEL